MRFAPLVALLLLTALACKDKAPEGPRPKAPEPFKPLVADGVGDGGLGDREAIFVVGPFSPTGPVVPEGLTRLDLHGELGAADLPAQGGVLLVPDDETFLVQVAPLLAALDDAGRPVWLKHPDVEAAYPLTLRDEPRFQEWVDQTVPGKLRVIQRADGFELQTNMGKLPGADANGPTVPARGGRLDLPTLVKGLKRIKGRFTEAPDFCLMPSFGTPMADAARALAANWFAPDDALFSQACLVYPRPKPRDAGR